MRLTYRYPSPYNITYSPNNMKPSDKSVGWLLSFMPYVSTDFVMSVAYGLPFIISFFFVLFVYEPKRI